MKKGINSQDIKLLNRGLALRLAATGQARSRADITKQMHLSKMTVTNIVGELLADGYLVEAETADNNQVGRNPITLAVAPSAPTCIGLYLARDAVHVIRTDLACRIRFHQLRTFTAETADSVTEKLIGLVRAALDSDAGTVLGIGIACIGPLDAAQGVLLKPTRFFGISNLPLKATLTAAFGLPVFVHNDMNAAALAEQLFGLGVGLRSFVYIGISNGIGSGIVSDGKLYQDSSGYVGEIGHMGVRFDGEVCSCGQHGCLELYASIPLILEKLRTATGEPDVACADFERLYADARCAPVFEELLELLAYAFINVVNILDPQLILLGHEGVFLPDALVRQLEQRINAGILSSGYKQIHVQKSSFGDQAPLLGSSCAVLQEVFSGQIYAPR